MRQPCATTWTFQTALGVIALLFAYSLKKATMDIGSSLGSQILKQIKDLLILAVDDEPDLLDITELTLISFGAKVLRASKDRKSTRLNSSHSDRSRMPSSA